MATKKANPFAKAPKKEVSNMVKMKKSGAGKKAPGKMHDCGCGGSGK